MKRLLLLATGTVATLCGLISCATARQEVASETAPADWNVLSEDALASSHGEISFSKHIKPVLEAKCAICHQSEVLPFFSLENREKAFAGSRIVPGKPDQSRLLLHAHGDTPGLKTMPPVGDRLTEDEKRILRDWIAQGAPWPTGNAGALDTSAARPR